MSVQKHNQVTGHAFISYVREDSPQVDRLQRQLQDAGIPVWRDTIDLWPGEDWRFNIRNAIANDALVFIACFSRNSVIRSKSFQNEELTLAIEQARLRRPEQPWLIPVRFDDVEIPDRDIGGGRMLSSIQQVDLFGGLFETGAARLVAAIRRILGTQVDLAASRPRGVAVVLCALNVEYLAVRSHLAGLHPREHPAGTRFEAGALAGGGWQVALAVTGPGNVGAAVLAERAIAVFSPDVLLCVGVAGSLKDNVRLGDIVVATRVDAYHGGTAAEDFLARPRAWPAPHRLDQLARQLDRDGTWRELLPAAAAGEPPAVHFRPIAAGEVVLDSRASALFAQLRLHNNDAAAIEMEGAGIAQAAHFNDALPALVIRGISDLADGTKAAADRQGSQDRASAHAAAFAAALLRAYTPPSRPPRP